MVLINIMRFWFYVGFVGVNVWEFKEELVVGSSKSEVCKLLI